MEKLIIILLSAYLVQSEKRIVLHSATDLAQEFIKLKSDFDAFKANMSAKMQKENSELRNNITTMASKLSSLESENMDLQNQLKTRKGMTVFHTCFVMKNKTHKTTWKAFYSWNYLLITSNEMPSFKCLTTAIC